MGRVKDWVIGMEEDASWMSRDSWAAKHGASNLTVYDETQDAMAGNEKYEPEPDFEESDGNG
tara:strand:- start:181 stop:366 length:186 start_codon:yes stop_codon:yes gene_type:complete